MIVFLNGRFVPENKAVVSVFDRSFLYGDGLFETVRICGGKPFRWQPHLKRLQAGARFLKIRLPFAPEKIRRFADALVTKNRMPEALLRVTLSRGVGVRGYSPKGATRPVLVMSVHPFPGTPASGPEGWSSSFSLSGNTLKRELQPQRAGSETGAPVRWKLITSSFRLPAGDPVAQFKTCNKLAQVLARAEADATGADEALLANTDGFIVEGAASNLFWIEGGTVCTPPLAAGILSGVTRSVVIDICRRLKVPVREKNIRPQTLRRAGGIFLSLSSFGVVEAVSLDGKKVRRSPLPSRILAVYNEWMIKESAR